MYAKTKCLMKAFISRGGSKIVFASIMTGPIFHANLIYYKVVLHKPNRNLAIFAEVPSVFTRHAKFVIFLYGKMFVKVTVFNPIKKKEFNCSGKVNQYELN